MKPQKIVIKMYFYVKKRQNNWVDKMPTQYNFFRLPKLYLARGFSNTSATIANNKIIAAPKYNWFF